MKASAGGGGRCRPRLADGNRRKGHQHPPDDQPVFAFVHINLPYGSFLEQGKIRQNLDRHSSLPQGDILDHSYFFATKSQSQVPSPEPVRCKKVQHFRNICVH
jgi:hypothetical protein